VNVGRELSIGWYKYVLFAYEFSGIVKWESVAQNPDLMM